MLKKIIQLLLINTLMAALTFLLGGEHAGNEPGKVFLIKLLHFQTFSFLCAAIALGVRRYSGPIAYSKFLLRVLPLALVAVSFVMLLLYYRAYSRKGVSFSDYDWKLILLQSLLPTAIITTLLTAFISRILHLEERTRAAKESADDVVSSASTGASTGALAPAGAEQKPDAVKRPVVTAGYSFREDENYYMIPHEKILYLSAHGRRTAVHTIDKDYATNMLLGEHEQKLPAASFIRIHKGYIVNIKMISHIQYFASGSYVAYLADQDETELPVGRKYAPVLKERMGL